MSGLVVEGNLALFRREFVFPVEAPQYSGASGRRTENQYLCLGWHRSDDPDGPSTVEWDLCFAAQRLSLLDIRIGVRLAGAASEADEYARKARQLETRLQEMNADTTALQRAAVTAGKGARRKTFKELGGIVWELFRRRPEIIAAVRHIAGLERVLRETLDDVAEETEKALIFRALGELRPLTGDRLRPAQWRASPCSGSTRRSGRSPA